MVWTSSKTHSPQGARSLLKVMVEINTELAQLHKIIAKQISLNQYIHATNYAEQYISYTSLWNIKFTYNFESPEVALIQLIHLEYIFEQESSSLFINERQIFSNIQQLFNEYKPYSDEMVSKRQAQMYAYIEMQNEQ
ncbi:hypothetical protein AAGS61_20140 [Lysinibacillus sp. KU-BSD001]|uniref:hypothetical protein n=1 Tax=Lysinibacillus sp. KU-BSD001 TaxID=3141328 RepID=UPI0036E54E0D